ncbi:MAG: hypothetical protein KBT36_14775 [Kurthia sp.]|nr:hypothetical protein [Candidatus Kurthia equi]
MLTKITLPFLRLFLNTYVVIFLLIAFIFINWLYIYIGGFIFNKSNDYSQISAIASLLGAAATTFTAVTASTLVFNWKNQHNLSLISQLTKEIWDLHSQLSAEISNLTYNFTVETSESEFKKIIFTLIRISSPLRTKSQQLQILLEKNLEWNDCETLEEYINFIDYFYPWSAPDFLDFRDDTQLFSKDFRYINSAVIDLFKKYISIE